MSTVVTGMVLSAMPIGDYDKRVVILTKEIGKISAFAKGARRPNSALLGCTQPFTFGKFTLFVGRTSYNINAVAVGNYFSEIRNDLDSMYYGMYFCEFVDYFTREENNEKEILRLLYVSLLALIKKHINNEMIRIIFELKVISLSGLAPHVFSCVKCNSQSKDYTYSIESDGIICEGCRAKDVNGIRIMPTTLYSMQYIIQSEIPKLFSFKVTDVVFKELDYLISQHKQKHLDYNFKSYDMLKLILSGKV